MNDKSINFLIFGVILGLSLGYAIGYHFGVQAPKDEIGIHFGTENK